VEKFAQGEGYLQVVNNEVLVLVEEAIPPDQLNRSDIESKLREAQQGAERAEDGSEEQKRYERNVKRYEAFLEVVGSSS
jgi:F0F1-type ATP synthase epsilon subunit